MFDTTKLYKSVSRLRKLTAKLSDSAIADCFAAVADALDEAAGAIEDANGEWITASETLKDEIIEDIQNKLDDKES